MNLILQKYAAALLPFLVVIVTAFQATLGDGVTRVEALQLAGIVAANVIVFIVPLLGGAWAAGLKVGFAVLGALAAAAVPIAYNAWNGETITILVLAGLNALAVQLGVSIRVSGVQQAILSPQVPNSQIEGADEPAYVLALSSKEV